MSIPCFMFSSCLTTHAVRTVRPVQCSPRLRRLTPVPARMNLTPDPGSVSPKPVPSTAPSWRPPVVGALWVIFLVHNFFYGPGDVADLGTFGLLLQGRTSEINDLLIAIFYALAQIAGLYTTLLLPAARRPQWLPTWPSCIAGIMLGFFGFGPYLAVRTYAPNVTADEVERQGPVARWFEGKGNAIVLVAFALYIYSLALNLYLPGDARDVMFYSCWQDTAELFSTDRWVHASIIDASILSVTLCGPLTEDMRRRGWQFDSDNIASYVYALCILAAPCIGPAIYLLLRPKIPSASHSAPEMETMSY